MLLIFLTISSHLILGQSLELGFVYDINEVITFINSAEDLPKASEELDGLEIDGTNKFAEVIDKYLLQVDHTDEDGEKYQKLKDLVEKIDSTWENFGTKDQVDKEELKSLPETRDELYNIYVENGTARALPFRIAYAPKPLACDKTMPEQLRQSKLHQAVALSVLRGFILDLKAGEDNQKAVAKGILQLEQIILASEEGFRKTNDDFRACDPPKHIRGETFGEFLGLFQGVVVNGGHTETKNGTSCRTCEKLEESTIDKCYKRPEDYGYETHCHRKKCSGRIFNCFHVEGSQTCELAPESDRRFRWTVSPGPDLIFGNNPETCDGRVVNILESKEEDREACLTCLCICAEEDPESEAIRTVSLMPQYSDILNNMVITGVRFQLKDKMFHLQIEQSKLGALSEIIPGTSEWKELPSVTYSKKSGSFKMITGTSKKQLHDNVDYKMFNMDSRQFNYDLLRAFKGELIVGVSFAYSKDEDAVQIQILSWPVDIKTGQLKDPVDLKAGDFDKEWINWENTQLKSEEPRHRMMMGWLEEPTLAPENPITSSPKSIATITASGFRADMAQHTIPYLTMQDVTLSDKKTALRSLEFYYARAEKHGGFVGFKATGYDALKLFQIKMTQEDIDKYKADFDEELPKEIPVKSA